MVPHTLGRTRLQSEQRRKRTDRRDPEGRRSWKTSQIKGDGPRDIEKENDLIEWLKYIEKKFLQKGLSKYIDRVRRERWQSENLVGNKRQEVREWYHMLIIRRTKEQSTQRVDDLTLEVLGTNTWWKYTGRNRGSIRVMMWESFNMLFTYLTV